MSSFQLPASVFPWGRDDQIPTDKIPGSTFQQGAPPRAGRANSRFQLPETAARKRRRGQIPTSNFREASPPRVTKKQIIDSRFQFPVSVAIRWWGARNWRSKTQVKTEFPERDNERVKFQLPELQFPTGMWECPSLCHHRARRMPPPFFLQSKVQNNPPRFITPCGV